MRATTKACHRFIVVSLCVRSTNHRVTRSGGRGLSCFRVGRQADIFGAYIWVTRHVNRDAQKKRERSENPFSRSVGKLPCHTAREGEGRGRERGRGRGEGGEGEGERVRESESESERE